MLIKTMIYQILKEVKCTPIIILIILTLDEYDYSKGYK